MKRSALICLATTLLVIAGCSTPADDPHAGHQTPEPAAAAATTVDHTAHQASEIGKQPEGYSPVDIPSDRQQLIGLKTDVAERATLSGSIRASATVEADETRDAHVHSRLMGWVKKLDVDAVGQVVEKGQPLYSLYSQELFAAQHEYVRARQTSPDLASAARSRLMLWEVPEDQIKLIERNGPRKEIVFRSPIRGTVIEKDIREGLYVEPDMMLYRITDLSRVWILAEVYEYEVDRIDRKGASIGSVTPCTRTIEARLDHVYPTVDPASRTVKIRFIAENKSGALRPGSFATVDLPTTSVEALWVPEAALIDTGVRQVVYLALENGGFSPVAVKAGRRMDGRVEIVAGLEEGVRVVTSAQFLLDSESRIRGSGNAPGHGGH